MVKRVFLSLVLVVVAIALQANYVRVADLKNDAMKGLEVESGYEQQMAAWAYYRINGADGIAKDYNEAVKILKKLVERDKNKVASDKFTFVVEGYNMLGDCYMLGIKDEYKAVEYWFLAAYYGHKGALQKLSQKDAAEILCNVGINYTNDRKEENDKLAIECFRISAENGYAKAQNRLGNCYYHGDGVDQNYTEAVKWYCKAAEQGYAGAQYGLGLCYTKGLGVTQSYDEALKWYEKAAAQGHTSAQEAFEKVTQEIKSRTITVNGVSFKMKYVEGGTFNMGSNDSEAESEEKPIHSVTLSDYYIGETEVTQELWEAVMGTTVRQQRDKEKNDWDLISEGPTYPMYCISWYDCRDFIKKLNRLTGKNFRLPTEAEWEYAARGGNKSKGYKYSGSNTIDDVAWYDVNAWEVRSNSPDYGTHQVGTKAPNELGLYDMSGNVWEWCSDRYSSSYYSSSPSSNPTGPTSGSNRVLRGGGWRYGAQDCRVANRFHFSPGNRFFGFRLALSDESTKSTNNTLTTSKSYSSTTSITPKASSKSISKDSKKSTESIDDQSSTKSITTSNSFSESKTKYSITVNGVSFKMVFVEGGTFKMGSNDSEAEDCEKPVHSVTLSDYYIGETEVTQELWEAVMGSNPSDIKGSKKPVEMVSWNDCQDFIKKLNRLTGKTFRLPTEAEWEYAARGGNKSNGYEYSGSNIIGDVAWYDVNAYDVGSSNSNYGTHQVGAKAPNELGIYDMSGNVWEWCSDWYSSSYYSSSPSSNPTGPTSGSRRVLRGGSWLHDAQCCRVAFRAGSSPGDRHYSGGFRLALCP